MLSVSISADHLEADWTKAGDGFYINAYEGGDSIGPDVQRVSIMLSEERVAELRRLLDLPKHSRGF